jgi:hypothetical protein
MNLIDEEELSESVEFVSPASAPTLNPVVSKAYREPVGWVSD